MLNIKHETPLSLLGRLIAFSILLFYTALALLPLYLMIVSSFIPLGTSFSLSDLKFFPSHPNLHNLYKFNERISGQMLRWFFNSIIVSSLSVASSIFFGTLAGYAMSKMRFPGRSFLFWAIICTMTIPGFVTLIPLYEMIWKFHWMNTYAALIVPSLAGIGSIFLSRQFLQTLPNALIESAMIDGCGEFGIFWRIILPMAQPLLGVLAIMGFVGAWQDFFWPYLVTESRSMYTIQVGILSVIGVDQNYVGDLDYGEIMAASLAASIPIFIIFLAAQKHFIKGLTIGAVKG